MHVIMLNDLLKKISELIANSWVLNFRQEEKK